MGVMINNDKRNIVYTGKMNENDTSKIIFFIMNEYRGNNKEPIHIYINSTGGDAISTLGLVDIISRIDIPIYTYNIGLCYSAAFFLFLAGKKRFTTKHALFMYHQTMATIMKKKMIDAKESIQIMNNRQQDIEKIIVSRTSITESELKEVYENGKNWFFDSLMALHYDIATDYF